MNEISIIIIVSWLAGLTASAGGLVAWIENSPETETKREITHGIIAFGGGILLAAVAFALLPPAIIAMDPVSLGVSFSVGGLVFCQLDVYLNSRGGTKAQFMAMLMDFLPEALAVGAVFGHDQRLGMLLAAFIGAQNLPEGFNSFREITSSGTSPRSAILALLAASLLGPLAACTGYFFLHDQTKLTGGIMTIASGGILYLIFQDIAPKAKIRRHWTPALGAVLGFAVGLLGKKLIG